ncbi:hypothetical protein NQ318_015019 [Aromia moschata]|uniref:Uncharacterized protein n=1 Tax=Aromia moschata TaxID=1265417 RepID=A0AAV8YZS6_9CUCU|nr:hypothetical protein NQ318_015019 [Aromia moschata]
MVKTQPWYWQTLNLTRDPSINSGPSGIAARDSGLKSASLFQLMMQKRDIVLTAVFSSLAALILIAGAGAACYFFHKRRRKRDEDEDSQMGRASRLEAAPEKKSRLNGFLSLKTPLISTKTLGHESRAIPATMAPFPAKFTDREGHKGSHKGPPLCLPIKFNVTAIFPAYVDWWPSQAYRRRFDPPGAPSTLFRSVLRRQMDPSRHFEGLIA